MVHLCDIPIDVWVVVLRHVDKQNIIDTYNKLFISRAINIPLKEKLNTFWIVVSQSRQMDFDNEFDIMPDSTIPKMMLLELKKNGMDEAEAMKVIRDMNGNDVNETLQLLFL